MKHMLMPFSSFFLRTAPLFLLFVSSGCGAQVKKDPPPAKEILSEERWESYMATYDNGKPGTVTVRMDLIEISPIKDFPFVLVSGVDYAMGDSSGLPDKMVLETLYEHSDALIQFVTTEFKAIYVGSFMHNGRRVEYFYLSSDKGVETSVTNFWDARKVVNPYIKTAEDKSWEYYKKFLYPNEDTQNYMGDEKVVFNLREAGDKLTEPRRVDHWAYFKSEQDMKRFRNEVVKLGYKVEKTQQNKKANDFIVQFWNNAKVDLETIHPVTSALRKLAAKHNGEYDGWETFVVK